MGRGGSPLWGFLCLDGEFRVLHASPSLDTFFGEGAAAAAQGRSVEALLGADVIGPESPLRHALLSGERREGLCANVRGSEGESHVVSVTAAPMTPEAARVCDPRVRPVVLRPAAEDPSAQGASTSFSGLVARSPAMAAIFRLIENLRQSAAGSFRR